MALFGKGQQSSSFGRGGQSSDSGAKPSSFSQKPAEQKSIPPKVEPQRPSFAKPVSSKPAAQKPVPQKPKTFFGEKKDWNRQDFINQVAKNPFGGGKMHSFDERKKILDKTFSPGRFSTYISEGETKQKLRELRNEEYRAKTGEEKSRISQVRKHIEKQTGLQGKY